MAGQSVERKKRRLLFAVICVDEVIFRRVRELFHGNDLLERFVVEQFVLDSVADYFEEFEQMPDLELLRSNMTADWEASIEEQGVDEDLIDEERELDEIYSLACRLEKKAPNQTHRVCHKIIDELYEFCLRLKTTSDLSNPRPLLQVLTDAHRDLQAGLSTGTDRFESIFKKKRQSLSGDEGQIATGISFVDSFIASRGPMSGDVIGHAAPRGAGKSTLASQVAVEVGKRERWLAKNTGSKARLVYLFNYEQIKDPMTQTIVNIANIPRDTIDEYMVTFDDALLSSGREYSDYELKRFSSEISRAKAGDGPWPLAERERLIQAEKFIEAQIVLVDFAGGDPDNLSLASQYVDGVKEYVVMHQRHVGNPGVAAVIIDYAGACVRTHISSDPRLSEDRHYRGLIDDLPLRCKREIANSMNCFVWISQQLAADEANKAGGSRPDPNKFKGCKSFAENCDFVIVNGMPTKPEGHAVFVQSKGRRGAPVADKVIRLHGKFSRWISAEATHAVVSGRAMDRANLQMLGLGNTL